MINAFESPNGPCKLVAMADIFGQRLEGSHKALSRQHAKNVDVPPERRFVGFDAYKKAIDCLRPGIDIPITFSGLRPGEKLFEELFYDPQNVARTSHEKIFFSRLGGVVGPGLSQEVKDAVALDDMMVREALRRWVPTFRGTEKA